MPSLRRSFSLTDREASIYAYIDFEIGARSGGFAVSLEYPEDGVTVIDLGLVGPDTFRGWSGGARRHVEVSEDWATPGYLPGPVTGSWQVVLGLYRVPETPVEVVVNIDEGYRPPPPPPSPPPVPHRPPPRHLPGDDDTIWLAGDLHSHTIHSDGQLQIEELLAQAVAKGLDFLAVTDHNTVSHHPHLEKAGRRMGILALPGQEVTTDVGHANCFGYIPWIDFREAADVWLTTTTDNDGLMSVNHPWAGHVAWRKPLTAPAPLVEMWHHTWDRLYPLPIEDWGHFGRVPIGGSDFHGLGDPGPGAPTTWVAVVEPTVSGVLDGLRKGRVAIGSHRDSPLVYPDGDRRHVVDGVGCRLIDGSGTSDIADDHVVMASSGSALLYADDEVASFTPARLS